MGYDDNTLIYIEENDKIEASIAAKGFADEEVKNRAYINSLGAELALKYLTSENINVSNIYNIHSIKKVLEATDISDIMLPNIHIDVRVIFDDNFIFIPKSHFEYNLVPDIYLIFNLAKDFTHVKFLGFFEPKLINKNNANDKYYFIEKEKLNPPIDLKSYIENFKGNTIQTLPDSEMENFESIMISMADNDISEEDKKYLLQQLTKSAELRDKFIEYENFELLSYTAVNDDKIQKREVKDDLLSAISTGEFSDIAEVSDLNDLADISETQEQELTQQVSLEDLPSEDEILSNGHTDFITSDLEEIPEIDDILADNTAVENSISEETEPSLEINDDKESGNLLGDAAAMGTAAILGAGAGAAAASAVEAVSGITDGIEVAKDSLDIIYQGLDFVSDEIKNNDAETNSLKNEAAELTKEFIEESDNSMDLVNDLPELGISEELTIDENIKEPEISDNIEPVNFNEIETVQESVPEIISIDDVDTSNLEEIELPEEEIKAETISIDNIDTSNVETHEVDFINEIDNKISFDDVELENTQISETSDLEIQDNMETMSLNDIDTTAMDDISIDDNIIENEKLSLDEIDTSNLQTPEIEIDDDKIDNTMSFDNIDIEDNDTIEAKHDEEMIDNDFLDDSMSFDDNDFEKMELVDENDYTNTDIEPLNEEPVESMEEIEKEKSESFGKNLLDGLSSENMSSDISIESLDSELDLPEVDNLPNAEDISSNDLLAEIDDILSTTQKSDEPQIPENEIPDTPIEDILGVNSLNEIIPDTQEPQNISEEIQSFDEITPVNSEEHFSTENKEDDIVSLIDNIETNYINDEPQYDETSSYNEQDDNDEKLGVLFDDNDSDNDDDEDDIASLASFEQDAIDENPEAFANVPGVALYKKQSLSGSQNKKTIIVAAALVAVLASVSVLAFLKSKGGDASVENLPPVTGETEQTAENTNSPLMPTEEVASKPADEQNNVLTNVPDINSIDKKEIQKAKSSNELKSAAKAPKTKPISSESYLSVQKLVWDVPDYLSYSSKMKNYLMTAGKSIKLSLSADLLLATEYAYSNQVKINLKLGNDGSVQDAKVVTSSGSEQIDKIVLQSVKDTLNVVKPPSGEVKGPNFNLSLIIYF